MFRFSFQIALALSALASTVAAEEVSISARGGVIPNNPAADVSIDTADGTEERITLAATETQVRSLTQRQMLIPAVVYLDGEQRLSLGLARMVANAQSLVIGKDAGVGELAAVADGDASVMQLQVDDAEAELKVNANVRLSPGAHTNRLEKLGSGQVRFAGDSYATIYQRGGSMVYDNFLDGAVLAISGSAVYDYCSNMELDPAFPGKFDSEAPLVASEAVVSAVKGVIPVAEFQVNGGASVRVDGACINQPELASNFDSMLYYAPDCGRVGSNSVGVLTFDGGAYTGKMAIAGGEVKHARGSLRLYGHASMMNVTSTNSTPLLGSGGYAHLDIDEADYLAAGSWCGAQNGQLFLSIKNGSFSHAAKTVRPTKFAFGCDNSDSVLYVGANGVFDASAVADDEVYLPAKEASYAYQANVLVQGGRVDFGTHTLHLRGNADAGTALIMARDGGVLRAEAVNGDARKSSNILGLLAFDGGTFSTSGGKTYPFGSDSRTEGEPVSGVYSFGSGLTLEVAAGVTNVLPAGGTVSAPLGYGVDSVTMTAAFAEKTFVGPPVIRFYKVSGTGAGAAAICDWDRDTGKVTAIRVLCRGWGYSETSTVLARVYYGSSEDTDYVAQLSVKLSDNAAYAGGLTKTGEGTLVLEGTNTYAGATAVHGGILRLSDAMVVGKSGRLELRNGATLDLGGGNPQFPDYGGDGTGVITNGTVTVTGLKIDFNRVLNEDYFETLNLTNVVFAEGAKLTLLNASAEKLSDRTKEYLLYRVPDGVPSDFPSLNTVSYLLGLPESWAVAQRGENDIVLKYVGGSIFIYY